MAPSESPSAPLSSRADPLTAGMEGFWQGMVANRRWMEEVGRRLLGEDGSSVRQEDLASLVEMLHLLSQRADAAESREQVAQAQMASLSQRMEEMTQALHTLTALVSALIPQEGPSSTEPEGRP